MKKIPYGVTDFVRIRTQDFYYVDKTAYIRRLEEVGSYLLFIRPRRFGKSLWLDILKNYYDINRKEQFAALFGDLDIGRNPTPEHNTRLILEFNFSAVLAGKDNSQLEASFCHTCNEAFGNFVESYRPFFQPEFAEEMSRRALPYDKMLYLTGRARNLQLKIYLFIDEYDNFANTVLSEPDYGHQRYRELTHGAGLFRAFFNFIKEGTTGSDAPFDRIYITGVSPITLDDVTSGYNIGLNLSMDDTFNGMLGFTEAEVHTMLDYYYAGGELALPKETAFALMSQWYDNYCFHPRCLNERVFNSSMALYFLNSIALKGAPPAVLVDSRSQVEYQKLQHLIVMDRKLNGNFSTLSQLALTGEVEGDLVESFPLERLTDRRNFVSLLFYFGILSIAGVHQGATVLRVPNETIRTLVFSYIADALRDTAVFRVPPEQVVAGARALAYQGDWHPYLDFMARQVHDQPGVRDLHDGEDIIKVLHLTYLYQTNLFITTSEPELNLGYGDLVALPNFHYDSGIRYAWLMEFKYLKADEPAVPAALAAALDAARRQLRRYAADRRFHELAAPAAIRLLAVVYQGFDRLACEEVAPAEA